MKRLIALMLCLALVCATLPVMAESEAPSTVREKVTDFFMGVADWVSDVAEGAQQTAENVGEWGRNAWENTKEGAKNAWGWVTESWKNLLNQGSVAMKDLGQWFTNLWSSLQGSTRGVFEEFSNGIEELKGTINDLTSLLERFMIICVRESLPIAADYVEELGAEKGVALPEDVQAVVSALRELAVKENLDDAKLEFQPVYDFLPQLGIDQKTFDDELSQRVQKHLAIRLLEAERACMNAMAAEKGLKMSSAASRAMDRLIRNAKGQLDQTDEEIQSATDIVEAWSKEAGIDDAELVLRVLDWLEQNPA